MALKLYMTNLSPGVRAVLMLAKSLNIELEHVEMDLLSGDHLTPEFLKLNPQHTIPILVDGDRVICDSHVINMYLIEKTEKETSLYPKDIYTRSLIQQRLFFDAEVLFQLVKSICFPIFIQGVKHIPHSHYVRAEEVYEFIEKFLENAKWMVGNEVTLADITIIASLSSLNCIMPVDTKYFKIHDWMARVRALPFYSENVEGLAVFKTELFAKLGKTE